MSSPKESWLINVKVKNDKGSTYEGHKIISKFYQKIKITEEEEDEVKDTYIEIPSQVSSDLEPNGTAVLELPSYDSISNEITFEVISPNGEILISIKTHKQKIQENKITIVVDPKEYFDIEKNTDPSFNKPLKIRGKVIEQSGTIKIAQQQVILWASQKKNPNVDEFSPLVVTKTDANGHFSSTYPLGTYTEAYGVVSVGKKEPIPISLEKDGSFPEYVILVVSLDGEELVYNGDFAPPRNPDVKDLTESEGIYSEDLGVGRCVDFYIPNRTLEEYDYYYVVRTTEPEIKGITLEEPGLKIPFSKITANYSTAIKLANLKFKSNPGFETKITGEAVARESTVPFKVDGIDAYAFKSIIDDPDKFTVENIAKATTLSIHKDFERLFDFARKPVPGRGLITSKNEIDWDHEPTIYQASTVAHGHLLHFKQEWIADGYSLGDLLYSLPLAPCQKKQIVVLDWERRDTASRTELLTEQEQLVANLSRDRDINEIVNTTLTESMRGGSKAKTSSFAGGLGIGAVLGPVGGLLGIGGGSSKASSSAWQNSSRQLAASSLQSLRDTTAQSASAIRSQRSTVIQTVKQGERVEAQTEVVANHNHCHAITIQYFEVLRHLLVRQRITDVQECLFIPLPISRFNSPKTLRWKETLSTFIRDHKLRKGFDALERIANNYEGSDFPLGTYADEKLEYLEGALKIRFQLARPIDTDDNYEASSWLWMGKLLPWVSASSFYNQYLKDQRRKDEIFHNELGQRITENFVKKLRFYAIDQNGARTLLPIDTTLLSRYQSNGLHHVSLRLSGELPNIERKNIRYIEISPMVIVFGAPIPLFDLLPTNSKVIVEEGHMRYRSKYHSAYLFQSSRIDNDIAGHDEVLIFTPLSTQELRNPRNEDKEISKILLSHLNEHIEYYHKVIWWNMSSDRRYMLLDGFLAPNSNGRSIASVVENRLIGIVGNTLIMPVSPGNKLDPTYKQDVDNPIDLIEHYQPTTPVEPIRIAIPTKGVFAEAVRGSCNSCEPIEEERFWRWEESPCPDAPTPILPVSTESRRAEPPDLTAKDFPTPMINLQNVPSAPDPTGLATALQMIAKPDLFRDITGLSQNQLNALAALQSSLQTAQAFGDKAANLALQKQMSKDIDKSVKTIKEAKTDGLISDTQASELTENAIRAQIGAGIKEQVPKYTEQPEVKNLLTKASETPSSEVALTGQGENVAIKIGRSDVDLSKISSTSSTIGTEQPKALIRYTESNFVGEDVIADTEFKDSLDKINTHAKKYNVFVHVTDSFRRSGTTVDGAIVPPATKSNHLAGHAIDMNPKYGENLYNSAKMNDFDNLPENVKNFLNAIRNDPDLRWGGDFTDPGPDPVHIDDNLNADLNAWQVRFDVTQASSDPE